MEEVHRLWHECLDGYQNPEEFRVKLNACIQALRNTTFAIQKEKSGIPDFDEWYAPWVARMKADPVMRWLQEARRTIVHIGDLDTRSVARVRLIATYFDATEEVIAGLAGSGKLRVPEPARGDVDPQGAGAEFAASPYTSVGDILDEIRRSDLPKRLIDQATLSIERRWVDSALPDYELLDALAHAYGVIAELISDAHDKAGLSHEAVMRVHGKDVPIARDAERGRRLPCMVTTRVDRTLNISLRDQTPTTGGLSWSTTIDPDRVARAEKRYKTRLPRLQQLPMSPHDWLPMFFQQTRAILRSGEEHGWFVFFFKGRTMVGNRVLVARDGAEKRALAQEIAEIVERNRFDGIIEIGEVWHAPLRLDDEGFPIPAAENPDRSEAIEFHAETADGRHSDFAMSFRSRRFAGPVIEDPIKFEGMQNNFLAPVRAVWRRWSAGESHRPDS